MGPLVEAIAQQESNGRYDVLGVETGKGRAIGKFQVMPYNVGPWTKKVLGTAMTPAQFLHSPEAQDAVGTAMISEMFKKHGNHGDVASEWFSGKPLTGNRNVDRALNNKTPLSYAKEVGAIFNKLMQQR